MSKAKEKSADTAAVDEGVKAVEYSAAEENGAAVVPAVKSAENAAVESAGFSCYIGPNLPGIIQTGTIYPKGKEEALELDELKLALSRKPGIAELVVDGSTLAEDRIKVKKPGEPLYKAFRTLKKQ